VIVRVLILLLVLALVASRIQRWLRQHLPARPPGPAPAVEAARKCPDCGAYVVGSRPEPCARPDCRYRPIGGA
jgi:hypothetical protein